MSSGSAAALPLLHQALGDSAPEVRAGAIQGLGLLKGADTEAAGELGGLMRDPNPVIREDAIRSLGNLGKTGLPGLLNALGDPYSALSDEAAKGILRIGADAIPSLQLLQQSPDPQIRVKARELLRRIQNSSPSRHD
jgi:HEAT repeat protein